MELISREPPAALPSGGLDGADFDPTRDTGLAVAPEEPRLGPGPGHPEVMVWARAL